ncbi:ABC transporter permease [Lactobacillus sp. ESL0731]|uniref:ABC transporter permease n=1 Tax=unclassified Lactobacillus TaxID=2620435 RepID=UPI0023F8F835|nr:MULTISPECIES: ABC transporter permease [unclassified Lactobacillus]WEV50575.1 ABC transporter permease [Lactobacillus sp. ESL0700]WEV61705.1 ABC transporter permease [Lactobacillus sp. ESL0731]
MRRLAQIRLQHNLRQSLKYLMLVFNDFFILALIFLFGALMYWYAQSMKTIPQGLWFYRPLVAVLLWLPLLTGNLVTLLQHADLQFLLPQDEQMNLYLSPLVKYSMVLPTLLIALLAGILFPFATIKAGLAPVSYWEFAIVVWLGKILQLKITQQNLYFGRKISLVLVNLALLIVLCLAIMQPVLIRLLLVLLVAGVIAMHFFLERKTLFDWRYAVALEEKRKNRVYTAFSMFTDVKEKQVTIKRRKYLDFLLPRSLKSENPNRFLYRRSLLRNPENLNLLVRMTAFAILISWLVQNWAWALGLSCLVIFLTAYQLLPMADEFDNNIMYRVAPILRQNRGHDLIVALRLPMLLQWLLISASWLLLLPFNLQLLEAIALLICFSGLIVQLYLPYKIKKRKI